MAQVYATLIRKGLRTIDNIPKDLRKAGYGSNLRYPYCKGQKDDQ